MSLIPPPPTVHLSRPRQLYDWLHGHSGVCMFLLVVYGGAAVRSGPVTLVTTVGMFSSVSPAVVDQVIRSLKFLPTEVACVAKLLFMHKLVFLQRVF